MTDQFDRASEIEEQMRQHAIRKQQQQMTDKSAVRFCLDCDEEIPVIRQKMGCSRCVNCQIIFEKHQRIYRR
ncbi:hypothetical protein B0186_05565 [Canicola haemoglobinophilus]|uniref:DnaK suppressor protein/ C4-type zinc finger protein, DksA/TraR family n=1 Tax=Canicola haemoglobinophilus TaxID=733 RepID=A0A1V4B165_9PAST|nr:TraR/DksA family transcriptional regulator [Canicola haemoglobinophilus]OOS00652.1 hypothetical protein B0186_05565 [Canicola haemoglobinophilus]STO54357.1 DnaK suppressor protein/ C4-type zinc finger protein, DksA/TraR family [Canicola haemoglobinophilus]STO60174.1 DnaK suppressor protein/ C4-type zinc finger protein, DksA/TraR family [Canicola haemoglobinophilus]STO68891.1 DnaK suppressor protein/ C4-type zinc finger protein, DksA/TraR family [Canicola haemoglobinophilus]